jgi:hypothetical protein
VNEAFKRETFIQEEEEEEEEEEGYKHLSDVTSRP